MEDKKKTSIDITSVNVDIELSNPVLRKIDSKKFANAAVLLKDDVLATYLSVAQLEKKDLALLNVNFDSTLIVPQINKKIITLGELASYYMVDIEELYESLEMVDFDLSAIKPLLKTLENKRKKYVAISEKIGLLEVNNEAEKYAITLEEAARLMNVPFKKLYNAFLLEDMNLGKTLKHFEKRNRVESAIKKMSKVISLPNKPGETELNRYRRYVAQGIHAKTSYYGAILKGCPTVDLEDTKLIKMFLINFDENYTKKLEMTEDDRANYLKYLVMALHHASINVEEFSELVRFSSQKRLGLDLNTMSYNLLNKSADKRKAYLKKIISNEIRLRVALSSDEELINRLKNLLIELDEYSTKKKQEKTKVKVITLFPQKKTEDDI